GRDGRAVGRGVVDAERQGGRPGERHGERGGAVPLVDGDVADAEAGGRVVVGDGGGARAGGDRGAGGVRQVRGELLGRLVQGVVVSDRPRPRPRRDGGVYRGRQVDGERLVVLERGVAVDRHADRLGGLARGERQGAGVRRVVGPGRGGAVGGGEVDRDRLPAG